MLGSEPDKPVYRPALSKDLWLKDDATLEGNSLAGDLDDDEAVDLVTDTTVTAIDPDAHVVRLADGSSVGYGKLLLATGAEPRTLAVDPGPRVVYYRTAADYERLRAIVDAGSHVVVVGGGYIGSEIASALVQNDVTVTLVLDLQDVQEQMFPRALAASLTQAFADRGVTVVHGSVDSGEATGDGVKIRLDDGTEVTGDAAVIGVGVLPRTGLAEAAGLARRQRHHRRRPPPHERHGRVRRGRRRVVPRRPPRSPPRRARRPRREVRRAGRQGDGGRRRDL